MELWRKNLYILWGTQFLAMMGMNLVVPFLPFFIRQLGVIDPNELAWWSGLVFSGPFLLSFFATPIWGTLGDKYGRKIMVVRAIFGLAISQVLIGFSQDVYQLFFFRIVQGAISGFIASALALVSTNTPKERMGYALGFLQSSTAGGMVLGPFVGGVLADLVGYREIFFLTATLCAIGGVVVLLNVRETTHADVHAKRFSVLENYRLMYTDKRLRIVGAVLVVGQVSVLMIEPIFALFIESFKTDTKYLSTLAGSIFSVSGLFMVASAPWWGKRNDRLGYKRNLYTALTIVGIAYALTSLFSPPERRGGMIAIASSLTILGNMLGPVIGGFIAGRFGITASFVANSCMLVTASLVVRKYLSDPPAAQVPVPATQTATEGRQA
jgi:DHA1 family multidrug resistance protein-like MFS transporter